MARQYQETEVAEAPATTELPRWLRMHDAQRLIGLSRPRLRQLVAEGKIRDKKDEDGWRVLLCAEDVEREQAAREGRPNRRPGVRKPRQEPVKGRTSARVFAILEKARAEGRQATLAELVIGAKVSPGTARVLWREWRTSLEAGEAERAAQERARAERQAQQEHEKTMYRHAQLRARARIARTQGSTPTTERTTDEERRHDEPE